MKKSYCYIVYFLLLSINVFGQDYLFNTRHLSVEDGMLGRRVNGVVQDNEGFIWISTNEGLNRFDGYRFEHYTKSTHGLNSNNIHRMGIDEVGDIWLTYWSDKFFIPETQILRPKTGEILSLEEKLGKLYNEEYRELRVTSAANVGRIYLSLPNNKKSLLIYKNNRLTVPNVPDGYRLIHSQNDEFINLTNENRSKIIKNDADGNFIDSIKINLDLEITHLNFTQTGGLIALGNKNSNSFAYYKSKSSATFQLIAKANGKDKFDHLQYGLWDNGNLYFEYQNKIIQFDASEIISKQPGKLDFDKQGNIWISTSNGVFILSIKPQRFQQYLKNGGSNKVVYDGRGIWANNETMFTFSNSGSYRYNLKDNTKQLILTSTKDYSTPQSVFKSKDNILWVGTRGRQLLNVDIETGSLLRKIKGATHQIWSIFEDKNGRIWIGQSNKGLHYFEQDKMEQVQKYTQLNGFKDIEKGKITQITVDKRDNNYLWLSCQSGWYRLHLKEGIKHHYWSKNDDEKFNIPADEIQFTHQDKNGDYWLASASSGLVKVTLNLDETVANTERFTIEEGLSSNTIYAIYEDEKGLLWLSTNNGINSFDKKTHEVQVFLEEDGLTHYEFNRLSNFQRKDGTIFFGTLNGIVSFHPKDLEEKKEYNVPLKISRCEKYSDEVERMVNVTTEVWAENKIIIRPNERLATLYVSLQNYSNSLQTKYLYRINGLHEEFVLANKNEIALNGLPYGKYTLEVKAKAPDGRFSTQMISIPLIVKRPFYFQWWFILLALVSLAMAIWQLFETRTRVLQSRKKELEEIVKDRTAQLQQQATELQSDKNTIEAQAKELKSLDEMKSRFFANISHELRTPLTLILSPAQSIIKRQKADNRDFTSAQIIQQNAQKLLKRINEILDLTKLEAKEMQLKTQPTPFYDFIKRLVANFEGFATEKEQQLSFDFQLDKNLTIGLDQDKYEHIFNNYLSNAIKFTPKGGKINIQLIEQQEKNADGKLENQIILTVKDNGQGIIKEDLPRVFDRFFQSKNNENKTSSSGIGLALSKEIANLMNGQVWVESELGKGSTFFFSMPYIEELGIRSEELGMTERTNLTGFQNLSGLIIDEQQTDKPTILLVEDNTQLRNYIQLILQEKYNVITAENGKVALNCLLKTANCELIISDIMMPEMNGFELLKKLKNSDEFRHIPVIMLTARTNAKLEALRIGVDDYITKPFDEDELKVRLDNLIKNAKNRVVVVQDELDDKKTEKHQKSTSAADLKWLEKVEKQLQAEVSNSKFNIDSLADVMNLSRSHLHRRIKTITGLTPNKYFREIKLQAAREILENGDAQTVSEVCYAVGFDTPKYFSKVYEQRFGKRPITYLRGS